MSDDYNPAREALYAAEIAGLRLPQTHLTWYETTPDEAERILHAFPDMKWEAHQNGPTQWLATPASGDVRLTAFVKEPERDPAPLTAAEDVLARFKGIS